MNTHGILLLICIRYSKCFDRIMIDYDCLIIFSWHCVEHAPHNARGHMKSLTAARGARVSRRSRGTRDEVDDDNHQESVMGGGASAFGGNVGGVGGIPPSVVGGMEFMQRVFTAIEQVVRNVVK